MLTRTWPSRPRPQTWPPGPRSRSRTWPQGQGHRLDRQGQDQGQGLDLKEKFPPSPPFSSTEVTSKYNNQTKHRYRLRKCVWSNHLYAANAIFNCNRSDFCYYDCTRISMTNCKAKDLMAKAKHLPSRLWPWPMPSVWPSRPKAKARDSKFVIENTSRPKIKAKDNNSDKNISRKTRRILRSDRWNVKDWLWLRCSQLQS